MPGALELDTRQPGGEAAATPGALPVATPVERAAGGGRLARVALVTVVAAGLALAGLGLAVDRPTVAGVSIGVTHAGAGGATVEVHNDGAVAFHGRLEVQGTADVPVRLDPGRSSSIRVELPATCRDARVVRLVGPGAPVESVAIPCAGEASP
jgi:hypothetical protein